MSEPKMTEGDVNYDAYNDYKPEVVPTEDEAFEKRKAEVEDAYKEQTDAWRAFTDALPKQETKAEREKREKRENSTKKIAAITDGLRALSNVFFTTQYAPSMYSHESGMSAAEKQRVDKLKAERDANSQAHLQYALGHSNAVLNKVNALDRLEAERERRRQAAELNAAQVKWYGTRAAGQDVKNKATESGMENDSKRTDSVVALNEKKGEVYDSQIKRNNSVAYKNTSGGGSKGGSKKSEYHFNGVTYPNDTEYAAAVLRKAEELNHKYKGRFKDDKGKDRDAIDLTWYDQTQYGSKPSKYDIARVAGEVESLLDEERRLDAAKNSGDDDNTPPSRKKKPQASGMNDDNTPPSKRK